ncbi:MAG: SUMF1/EgtB/PvdO family nonheme iron enzyme, partial [Fibrobacteraceae bacterium]|nr:SUMF1/EgtB/PvdO family nonheme iron enzyme [Fibrobacteraceae bacterium]
MSPICKPDGERQGFVNFFAKGNPVTLGTKEVSAKSTEQPEMQVVFTYDFSLQQHEVTREEFMSLMKGFDFLKDNKPVTNITFFDAVLYANAKSVAEGLDTVYSYEGLSINSNGNCIGMDGFKFHGNVDGYRLPTEAEWVYVASLVWDVEKSWNASNSGNVIHEVCTKASSKNEICDMAGNAMEWVNDWLGFFRDTTMTNFAGAIQGGALEERVVKGGAFFTEKNFLNYYSRGGVYAVTPASKSDYVGFRLAIGPIPEASYLNYDGGSEISTLNIVATAQKVKKKAGTFRGKLAFRNDASKNLVYVNYASPQLFAVEIQDTLNVFHPDISPDGNRVAFCTKIEGVSGKSEL